MQKQEQRCVVAVMALFFLTVTIWPVWAGDTKAPGDKVAVVNGVAITKGDFDRELNRAKQVYGMGKPISHSQLPMIKNKTLENLVEREVLYQESQKKGVKVDQSLVNQEFEKLKSRFPGEEEFKKGLSRMNLTESLLKSEIGRAMAVQQLIEEGIVVNVEVTEKELQAYYDKNTKKFKQPEQVKASHILVGVDSGADASKKAEARKKIEEIAKKLKKGGDFSALAKESSSCPSSAKGGDLGLFGRGQMVKPFEAAAFALKPGEVSDIVETQFGYHLIKVVEKKTAKTLAFKDVKERLEQQLKESKVRDEMGAYVAKLKEKAKVERLMPVEK